MTTLADILRGVEGGVFPTPDLSITVVPAPSERELAVVAFTAHIVIAVDVSPDWVAGLIPDGDLSAPLNPPFLFALEQLSGRRVNAIDQMLLAPALTDPTERAAAVEGLVEVTERGHPRIERAWRYRDDVRAYAPPYGGLVLTGRGLAGRPGKPRQRRLHPNLSRRRLPTSRLRSAAGALAPRETPWG